ncbi:riboflavin synthase subunit alpha [Roseateles saccharophilus]|uniref:Riboflavin synthase n=1 Tax=Roseateles saccharophilus TaxID=304 RepID=A0A4R3VED5_ROSSA|nr:riboflavin synthase subunit alpha [Roseateles saccharophilus]MDG0834561.1 riboflavin synthase subunit alpha [Roseateles saccharophilus]TCV03746.1 riboflavin synthase alpha chain [Roseateles saccharophilus]
MFTGIVQGVARVESIEAREGLHTLHLKFPQGFDAELAIGASVSCDGVCLTVTERPAPGVASFDVMAQTLRLTTLGGLMVGSGLNVERAAKEGVEIGGHPLSGHVDVSARIAEIRRPDNNHVIRFALPAPWMRYVFAKGYIGVNGCSLTVAEARRERDGSGWFEVWLIPETLRMTTFGDKTVGDAVHIEIERSTQVVVDTVRDALDEKLGPLLPVLEAIAAERGIDITQLALSKS